MTYLARLVSEITNPIFVALPTFLAISLVTAPTLMQGLIWWAITVIGISLAPFAFILRGVQRGHYSDHHISKREQRLLPLLFALCCIALVFVLLVVLQASRPLLATLTAVMLAIGIATMITTVWKWKISLHLVGIAGSVTTFVWLFGLPFLVLSPLIVLVAWARWQVRAHTWLQAVAGSILAGGMTVVVFWLFGVH